MSSPSQETITCPGCGGQQEFVIWKSVNVTLDPEKKAELIKGDLTRFVCQKCGWSGEVAYPLLYHDMTNRLMISVVQSGRQADLGDFPFAALMHDYKFRLVSNRNELVEKLLILDGGLDDRMIECFKWIIRAGSLKGDDPLTGTILFSGIGRSENGEEVIQFAYLHDDQKTLDVPLATFNDAREPLAGLLPPAEAEQGKWLRVDTVYAKSLLDASR